MLRSACRGHKNNPLSLAAVTFNVYCTFPQIAGGQRYRPPSVDVNAPDLFIPLMGLWSYALMSCIVLAFKHTFKPELMSGTVSSSSSDGGGPKELLNSAMCHADWLMQPWSGL
jgi:hypothetical protein